MILNGRLKRAASLGLVGALAVQANARPVTAQVGKTPAPVHDLLKAGEAERAVEAYDAYVDHTGRADRDVLLRLTTAVLERATTEEDRSLAVEACLALLSLGEHACRAGLRAALDSPAATPGVRLRVAAALQPEGGRATGLARILEGLEGPAWVAAVDATAVMPPSTAVAVLARVLAEAPVDVRYAALVRLSTFDSPEALRLLRRWSHRPDTPGHLIALAAVGRAGDRDAIARVRSLLPELHGQDLLAAGVALAEHGEPEGFESIEVVLSGPDALLQIEAAAALARLNHGVGLERLEADLNNPDVWIRLRTLEQLRGLAVQPNHRIWRQMADPLAWVRVRAAQRTLEGLEATAPEIASPR